MSILHKLLQPLPMTRRLRGMQGEAATALDLTLAGLLGHDGRLLRNLYVPCGNGRTTEIDLLYITRKGLFVIEKKNYAGWIFGSEDSQNWTVSLYAGRDFLGRSKTETHQFYNPIRQNQTHIGCLTRWLGRSVPMFSLVIFSSRCQLKNVPRSTRSVILCREPQLQWKLLRVWHRNPDVLTPDEVKELYDRLQPLTHADAIQRFRHVQAVKSARKQAQSPTVCPRCGGELVVRTARSGPTAGQQFYGCSNFPRCRYTRNL